MQPPYFSLVDTCHHSNDIHLSLTLMTLTFDNDESPPLAAGLVSMVTTFSCFPNYRLTLFDRSKTSRLSVGLVTMATTDVLSPTLLIPTTLFTAVEYPL